MKTKEILNILLLNKVEEIKKLWFTEKEFRENKSLWIENLFV